MTAYELEKLAFSDDTVIYHAIDLYGLSNEMSRYGFFPKIVTFPITGQHGSVLRDAKIFEPEAKTIYPIMAVYNKKLKRQFLNSYSKKTIITTSPFVTYKNHFKIKKSFNAKGTIYFPEHSSNVMDIDNNVNDLIEKVNSLSDEFKPVTFCFHFIDIRLGYHKPYLAAGFNCVTAGHYKDPLFMKRFYDILKNYKYAMGNSIGSHTFYAVDMGIPYSLNGDKPTKMYIHGKLYSWERYKQEYLTKYYPVMERAFAGLQTTITDEQAYFARENLGVGQGIGRLSLAFYLYIAYIIYIFKIFPSKVKNLKHFLADSFNKMWLVLKKRMITPIFEKFFIQIKGLKKAVNKPAIIPFHDRIYLYKRFRNKKLNVYCNNTDSEMQFIKKALHNQSAVDINKNKQNSYDLAVLKLDSIEFFNKTEYTASQYVLLLKQPFICKSDTYSGMRVVFKNTNNTCFIFNV